MRLQPLGHPSCRRSTCAKAAHYSRHFSQRNLGPAIRRAPFFGPHQLLSLNLNTPLPGTYNPTIPTSGVRPLGNAENAYQYTSEGVFNQNQLIANVNMLTAQAD